MSLKVTISTLLNLNCKRVRTHSPTTLLSSMTSSSSSSPSTTAVVSNANVETNSYNHKQYLSLCSIITAGLLNEDLGSDEQEIIEMINLIIDVDERKVSSIHSLSSLKENCWNLDGRSASSIHTTDFYRTIK